jgi:hypothetical protein
MWMKALIEYFKSIAGVKGKSGGATVRKHPKKAVRKTEDNVYAFRFSVHPDYAQYTGRIYINFNSLHWGTWIEFERKGSVEGDFPITETERIYKFLLQDYDSLPCYVWASQQIPKIQSVTGIPFSFIFSLHDKSVVYYGKDSNASVRIDGRLGGSQQQWDMSWTDYNNAANSKNLNDLSSLEAALDETPVEGDSNLTHFTDKAKRKKMQSDFRKILGTPKVELTEEYMSQTSGEITSYGPSKHLVLPRGSVKTALQGYYTAKADGDQWDLSVRMNIPFRLVDEYNGTSDILYNEYYKALKFTSPTEVIEFYKGIAPALSQYEVKVNFGYGELNVVMETSKFDNYDQMLRRLQQTQEMAKTIMETPFPVPLPNP